MDREKIRAIEAKVMEALGLIEADCGVKFMLGRGTFTDTNFVFKVEAAEIAQEGKVLSKAVESWKLYAYRFGLPEDGVGKKIAFRGHEYEIQGLNPRRPAFPIDVKRVPDGKLFRMPLDVVVQGLGGKPAKPLFPTPPWANKGTAPKRTEQEILDELRKVHCALSPENLTCDGELSRSAVRAKEAVLHAQLIRLEAELGRKPTDEEIWNL